MKRLFVTPFFFTSVSLTCLIGQIDTASGGPFTDPDTVSPDHGYLIVECDSVGIDIYLDDILVGQIPIDQPIPVQPGKHTVTYLHPGFLSLLSQHYSEREISSLISKSLQTVYIVSGQTVSVNLWWRPYERELKSRRNRFWIKSMVGVALLAALLSLNVP